MAVRGVVVVAGLAVVLVLGGVALVATSPPVTFGWFAYAPLSGDSFPSPLSNALVLSRRQSLGAGAAGVGLVLLAAVVGYVVGRRRPARG